MKTTLQILMAFYAVSASAASLSLKSTNDYIFVSGFPTNADFRGIGTGENGIYSIPRLEDRAFLSEAMSERTILVFSRDNNVVDTNANNYAITGFDFTVPTDPFERHFSTNYEWRSLYVPDNFRFTSSFFRSESSNGWILASNDLTSSWKPLAGSDSRFYTTNDVRTAVNKSPIRYYRVDGQLPMTFLEITNTYHNLKLMNKLIDSNVLLRRISGDKSKTHYHIEGFSKSHTVNNYVTVRSGIYTIGYYSDYSISQHSLDDDYSVDADPRITDSVWAQYYKEVRTTRPVLFTPVSADSSGHWSFNISERTVYDSYSQYFTVFPPENGSARPAIEILLPRPEFKLDYPPSNRVDVALLFLFELTDSIYKRNSYVWPDGKYVGSTTNVTLPSQHVGVFFVTQAERSDADKPGVFRSILNESMFTSAATRVLTGLDDMTVDDPFEPVQSSTASGSTPGWFFPDSTNWRIKQLILREFRAFAISRPNFRTKFEE